jgi:hypothetical protein
MEEGVDPEDGGPDEGKTATSNVAASIGWHAGYASYPTPEDSEGPNDPRASDGRTGTLGASYQVASPPDGGQGDQPTPPKPEC